MIGSARDRVGGFVGNLTQYARAYIESDGNSPRGVGAAMFALLLVMSMVAPFAAVGAADTTSSTSPPDGMVGVPSDNVHSNVPAHVDLPTSASAWSAQASEHAGDLEVTVATRSRASLAGAAVDPLSPSADDLVLEFSDERNHEGREVAVDASTLVESVGHRPEAAYGIHESGERWTSPISYEDGSATWEVPRFSTNSVTFSGSVRITASPGQDGSQYNYDLESLDAVDNFTVDITGSNSTAWTNISQRHGDGATITTDVNGTTAPAGPGPTGSPELRAIGVGPTQRWSGPTHSSGGTGDTGGDSGIVISAPENEGTVYGLDPADGSQLWNVSTTHNYTAAASDGGDIYLGTSFHDSVVEARSRTDGSSVWTYNPAADRFTDLGIDSSNSHVIASNTNNEVHAINQTGMNVWTYTGHTDKVQAVGIVSGAGIAVTTGNDQTIRGVGLSGGTEQWSLTDPASTGFAATGGSGDSAYVGTFGGTLYHLNASDGTIRWTVSFPDAVSGIEVIDGYLYVNVGGNLHIYNTDGTEVSSHTTDIQRLGSAGGNLTWGLSDGTATSHSPMSTDVSVAVDGTTQVSQTGPLEVSSALSSEVDLSRGSHTIDVSTSGDTEVRVELDYEEITETVDPAVEVNGHTTSYTGTLADGSTTSLSVNESWVQEGTNRVNLTVSEAYDGPVGQVGMNYSHESVDNQSVSYNSEAWSERYNVSKTYASDRSGATLEIPYQGSVIDVRTLEKRVNGTTWETIPESSYSLSGTDLTVDVGDVNAGTSVEVRTTGTKVNVVNGSIEVTDPTVLEDDLATEFEITSYSSGFHVEVNATAHGDNLHYTYDESYSGAESYARVESGGAQAIYMPQAGAGDSARVGTIPLEPQPSTGHVDVRVESAGSEPEFTVMSTTTSSDITFVWNDTVSGNTYQLYSLDADEERSRATASSPVELLHDGTAETLKIFDLGSGGGGGGGGAAPAQVSGDGLPLTQPERLILVIGAVLAGLFVVSRRTGDSSISGKMLLFLVAPIAAVLAFSSLAPERMVAEIALGLRENLSLILLFAGAALYLWYRQRKAPDTRVSFNLGRNR